MKSQREILAENLETLIDRRGIDQKILAEKLGVSDMTVSNWVRGLKYPRIDKLQALADFFNVRHADLVTDTQTNFINEASNVYQVSQRTIRIPVLGDIACGDPILAEENYEDYRTVLEDNLPNGDLVFLKAKGDSMKPTVPDSSWVLIRIQEEVENGEIAAVTFNGNTEVTLKRVKKQGDNIILMPDNRDYEPIFVDIHNPIRIIGKAIKVEMDL